jgi:diaminopimelate epimerase
MAHFYDARGNTYFVASPEEIGKFAEIPRTAAAAAMARGQWAVRAIERICVQGNASFAPAGATSAPAGDPAFTPARATAARAGDPAGKRFLSDGLLVGPFPGENAFGMLVVNTDGTLAERSGNGLTIFSQFLVDTGQANRTDAFVVRIYHDKPPAPWVEARIEAAVRDGRSGFWVDMGVPTYGPSAVGASPVHVGASEFEGRSTSRVFALEQIEPSWTCSQFVNVGNPHCVTFLKDPSLLPSMEQIGSRNWKPRLTAIANSTASDGVRGEGRPCKHGINLQWASLLGPDTIAARVFERGEGPTLSSGSSATAVASAARKLQLLGAKTVKVAMPGGVAPVRFDESEGILKCVMLFGEAQRTNPRQYPQRAND